MCFPLEHCCFCVSLDVGAKVISIISLAGSVMACMVYGTAAMLPPPVEESRKIVYAVIATVAMVKLLTGCLLIYGVFGRKPALILPWLINCCILVISMVALSVLGTVLIVLQYTRDQDNTKEVSTMVAVYFIMAVVLYWFRSVISSRRGEMLRGTSGDSARGLLKDYRSSS